MPERPSCWTRRLVLVPGLALALAGAAPGGSAAQDDLDAACATASDPSGCRLAAAAVRVVQPRIGLALWGGSPVPGTASTAGVRLRGSPRWSVAARLAAVPAELPPLLDRTRSEGSRGLLTAVSIQTTLGVAHGFAPLPTVGGFLSIDLIARLSAGRLPGGRGFDGRGVWGWAAGARLGLLRESFTLPGLSLTATYGRSSRVSFGDPDGPGTDGAYQGSVAMFGVTAAASRRLFGLRLGGGLSWDRYTTGARLRYGGALGQAVTGDAVMERWSGYGTLTWTRLIWHATLEAGLQEAPAPTGLPPGVAVSPVGWWLGLAFRVTP